MSVVACGVKVAHGLGLVVPSLQGFVVQAAIPVTRGWFQECSGQFLL